jgi:hypothetical protein
MAEPYDDIRESLARSRAKGRPFARAWEDALAWAGAGHAPVRVILDETRDAWRRAYERAEPTPGEHALILIGEGREPLLAERAEHPCGWCDAPIPPVRLRHGGEWCSEKCRKAAGRARTRQRRISRRRAATKPGTSEPARTSATFNADLSTR